ncbi:MAG: gamma-glutamylcyclotransferase [Pseudonocardia sp.]|nr:gamma-glutamylcyclotransferase [Pseudonocardia sp.]
MWADAAYPAAPYPGEVPPTSYVHDDGAGYVLAADGTTRSGWRAGRTDLDDWLGVRGAPRLAERFPVLAYGSNRNPSKISWLRAELGLRGPVVVLRARTEGVAAVWAHGLRVVDDQRPAVLAAAPRVREEHSVWFATAQQLDVLDVCEGRASGRYRLAHLHTGTVTTEDGAVIDGVLAYLGDAGIRRPLLVDGAPVRCADVGQSAARALGGDPAPGDGLAATTVEGRPGPWPPRLFVYGSLQPGERAWNRLSPALDGRPRRAELPGTLLDTGYGYPAMLRLPGPGVPGWVVPVREPAALLPALDAYEGPQYARVRVGVPGTGEMCWSYVWTAGTAGFRVLDGGWPGDPP